jgi:Holliday junction resolvasome RuvABC endonuclease subunit
MKVLGCDCSTRLVAIFAIQNKEGSTYEFKSSKEDAVSRTNDIFFQLVKFFKSEKPDMVYVENSPYLQNIKVTLQIHSVVDAVRYACLINDIPMQTVEVTSWKKDVLGSGKADKPTIMQFAKAKWGSKLITNQDIADSSCIATYGNRRMEK